MTNTPLLSVRNLTSRLLIQKKAYTVVDRLSFDLNHGETLALVGESGCGKSLTALSLLRILPTPPALPSSGEILYKGQDLLKLSEHAMRRIRGAKISMIFQDPMSALNPVYTIGDQLNEVVELHLGLYGEEAELRILKMLEQVSLPDPEKRLNDYPHQLSGGMKQRVMIAMALLCEPDILIADEPTTALDVTVQRQVLELIRALQKKKGTALLLITHDLGVVAEMADRAIVMYATQEMESGTVFDLFDNRSHPYTQGLFDSRPSEKAKALTCIKGSVPSINKLPEGCHFHPRCPYVMEKCKHGEVPLFTLPSGGRSRCWLHEGSQAVKD
jgi:oligopeptide/dipeptide ABC transporter ATP-binding protein